MHVIFNHIFPLVVCISFYFVYVFVIQLKNFCKKQINKNKKRNKVGGARRTC